jgi:hypothetical protein
MIAPLMIFHHLCAPQEKNRRPKPLWPCLRAILYPKEFISRTHSFMECLSKSLPENDLRVKAEKQRLAQESQPYQQFSA